MLLTIIYLSLLAFSYFTARWYSISATRDDDDDDRVYTESEANAFVEQLLQDAEGETETVFDFKEVPDIESDDDQQV